jgi:hypothetical protein
MSRRSLVLLAGLGIVLVILGAAFSTYQSRHRSLHIETDAGSLKFAINDQTYTISGKSLDISLKPGVYNYRAVSTVSDKRVVLTDSVNLTQDKSASLKFNFSLYDNQAILKAICASISGDASGSCPFSITITRTDFAENYAWAVVQVNSPDLGKAVAVLRVDNGEWEVVDGPATDINTGGYFPESVERIIRNEQ